MRDRNKGKKLEDSPMISDERDSSFSQELMTSEHIPYAMNIFQAIESVRRGIAYDQDGGIAALLALYSILPSKIRAKFTGLAQDVDHYCEARKLMRITYTRRKVFHPAGPARTEWNPDTLRFEEKRQEAYSHDARVPRKRIVERGVFDRRQKRLFVSQKLMEIIDVLEKQGILWKSRLELVGGEP